MRFVFAALLSLVIYRSECQEQDCVCKHLPGAVNVGVHCFHSPSDQKTWEQAKSACQDAGGDLASINSLSENGAVESIMKSKGYSEAWIGFTDASSEGTFYWSDQSGLLFERWAGIEPNDWQGNEDCTTVRDTGYWNDLDCSLPRHFICKSPAQSVWKDVGHWFLEYQGCSTITEADYPCLYWNTTLYASDFDESDKNYCRNPKFWNDPFLKCELGEVKFFNETGEARDWDYCQPVKHYYGTCSDGVQNQGEVGVDCGGTCEACATCSDGVLNQLETFTDCGGPCQECSSCPSSSCGGSCPCGDGCSLPCSAAVSEGGRTFRIVRTPAPLSRDDAELACAEAGETLASIHTAAEHAAVTRFLAGRSAWIGLQRADASGVWAWDDGSSYGGWDHFGATPAATHGCVYIRMDWDSEPQGRWADVLCAAEDAVDSFVCAQPQWCAEKALATAFSGGKCFFAPENHAVMSTEPLTSGWNDARAHCASVGGDLVSVASREENVAVWSILAQLRDAHGTSRVWIGINDQAVEGAFVWSDGTTPNPTAAFWSANEPNDANGAQDCGVMWTVVDAEWDDEACGNAFPFVCEVAPPAEECASEDSIEGHCLRYVGHAFVEHAAARAECEAWGGSLAVMDSAAKVEWLASAWHGNAWEAWIGLARSSRQVPWEWPDGAGYVYARWGSHGVPLLQSAGSADRRLCVVSVTETDTWWDFIREDAHELDKTPRAVWHPRPCDARPKSFVCSKPLPGAPPAPSACTGAEVEGRCLWSPPHVWMDYRSSAAACERWGGTLATPPAREGQPDCCSWGPYSCFPWLSAEECEWYFPFQQAGVLLTGWIGLRRAGFDRDSVWEWEDGAFYSKSRFRTVGGGSCAALDIQDDGHTMDRAVWRYLGDFKTFFVDHDCSELLETFTCARQLSPPAVAQASSQCDGNVMAFGKCWWLATGVGLPFESANAQCEAWGGELASITSEEQAQFLTSVFDLVDQGTPQLSTWIGLRSLTRGQLWAWEDGAPYRYTDWASADLSAAASDGQTELCAAIDSSNRFESVSCHAEAFNMLCSKDPFQALAKIHNPSFEAHPPASGVAFQRGSVDGWQSEAGVRPQLHVQGDLGLSSGDGERFASISLGTRLQQELSALAAGGRYRLSVAAAAEQDPGEVWSGRCLVQRLGVYENAHGWILHVTFEYRDGSEAQFGPGAPESGPAATFELGVGEVIVGVEYRAGACTNGFRVVTNQRTSAWFGDDVGGGPRPALEATEADPIVGLQEGGWCNPLGGVVRKSELGAHGCSTLLHILLVDASGEALAQAAVDAADLSDASFREVSVEFTAQAEGATLWLEALQGRVFLDAVRLERTPGAPSLPPASSAMLNLAQQCDDGPCPTAQSSVALGGVAARAVDGMPSATTAAADVDPAWCMQTQAAQGLSWWRLDLGQERQVGLVKVWNRGDGGRAAALAGFEVRIGNEDHPLGNPVSYRGERVSLAAPFVEYARVAAAGRFLFLVLRSAPLHVCEVEVFGFLDPAAIASGSYAHYSAADYDARLRVWRDSSGNGRDSTDVVGNVLKRHGASGHTAGKLAYLEGDQWSGVVFPSGSVPTAFSICATTRWTDAFPRGRILDSAGPSNWVFGHWAGIRGMAFWNGWQLDPGNPPFSTSEHAADGLPHPEQWLVMCGNNRADNVLLVDGMVTAGAGGGAGGQQLTINAGIFAQSEPSAWSVAEIVVWDYHLSNEQLLRVSDWLHAQLRNGDALSFPLPQPDLELLALAHGLSVRSPLPANGDFEAQAECGAGGVPGHCAVPSWNANWTVQVAQAAVSWGGMDSGDGEYYLGVQGFAEVTQTIQGLIPGAEYSLRFLAARSAVNPPSGVHVVLSDGDRLRSGRGGVFEAGEPVMARYKNGKWYQAVIQADLGRDTYLLFWNDGDTSDTVKHAVDLQRSESLRIGGGGTFEVGDIVMARYANGNWYQAVIQGVLGGDLYSLAWNDGDTADTTKHSDDLQRLENRAPPLLSLELSGNELKSSEFEVQTVSFTAQSHQATLEIFASDAKPFPKGNAQPVSGESHGRPGLSGQPTLFLDAISVVLLNTNVVLANGDFEADAASLASEFGFMDAQSWRASPVPVGQGAVQVDSAGVIIQGPEFEDAAPVSNTAQAVLIKQGSWAWGGLSSGDGACYLGLAGANRIEQQVEGLLPGEEYTLWFKAAKRPWYAAPTLRVEVKDADSQTVLESVVLKGATDLSGEAFEMRTVVFNARAARRVLVSFDTLLSPAAAFAAPGGIDPQSTAFVDAAALTFGRGPLRCDGSEEAAEACWWVVRADMGRERARQVCLDWGGHLAGAADDGEEALEAMARVVQGSGAFPTWVGRRSVANSTQYVWEEDGEAAGRRGAADGAEGECTVHDGSALVAAPCDAVHKTALCRKPAAALCSTPTPVGCRQQLAAMGLGDATIVHAGCCGCCFFVAAGSTELRRVGTCASSCSQLSFNGRNLAGLAADVFSNLPDVRVLDLRRNLISRLPAEVFDGVTGLRILRLDHNRLEALPRFEACLLHLRELHASHNRLTALPADVLRALAPNLSVLALRGNALAAVGPLTGLPRLSHLDLSANLLASGSIGPLDALVTLRLHQNRLPVMPQLRALPRLVDLSLDRNQLAAVRANETAQLVGVRLMDLSGNAIAALELRGLPSLERLDASRNQLAAIRVQDMPALAVLNLSRNALEAIEADALLDLPQLRALDLSRNRISAVRKGALQAEALPGLDALDLSRNQLEWPRPGVFADLGHARTLDLRENPLACQPQLPLQIPNILLPFMYGERDPCYPRECSRHAAHGVKGVEMWDVYGPLPFVRSNGQLYWLTVKVETVSTKLRTHMEAMALLLRTLRPDAVRRFDELALNRSLFVPDVDVPADRCWCVGMDLCFSPVG